MVKWSSMQPYLAKWLPVTRPSYVSLEDIEVRGITCCLRHLGCGCRHQDPPLCKRIHLPVMWDMRHDSSFLYIKSFSGLTYMSRTDQAYPARGQRDRLLAGLVPMHLCPMFRLTRNLHGGMVLTWGNYFSLGVSCQRTIL